MRGRLKTAAQRLTVGTELANAELPMSDLSDAIKALENDAQYLRDNLTNLDDPPTAQQLQLVEAFISVIHKRLDRLREVTALAKKQVTP